MYIEYVELYIFFETIKLTQFLFPMSYRYNFFHSYDELKIFQAGAHYVLLENLGLSKIQIDI